MPDIRFKLYGVTDNGKQFRDEFMDYEGATNAALSKVKLGFHVTVRKVTTEVVGDYWPELKKAKTE